LLYKISLLSTEKGFWDYFLKLDVIGYWIHIPTYLTEKKKHFPILSRICMGNSRLKILKFFLCNQICSTVKSLLNKIIWNSDFALFLIQNLRAKFRFEVFFKKFLPSINLTIFLPSITYIILNTMDGLDGFWGVETELLYAGHDLGLLCYLEHDKTIFRPRKPFLGLKRQNPKNLP
jgi:hypothetical protein